MGNVFQMEEPDGKNETLSSLNITSLETAELAMSLTLQREESDTSNLEGSSTACNESDVNCESKDSHSEEDADDFLYRTGTLKSQLKSHFLVYKTIMTFSFQSWVRVSPCPSN